MTRVCKGILSQQKKIFIASLYLSLRACEANFVIARDEAISPLSLRAYIVIVSFICHCEVRSNLSFVITSVHCHCELYLSLRAFICHCEVRSNLSFVVGQRWKARSPRCARDDNTILSLRGTKQSLFCCWPALEGEIATLRSR